MHSDLFSHPDSIFVVCFSIQNFDMPSDEISRPIHVIFNNSVSHALSSFDLIHYDVWGPSPISTPGGSSYFVIFVDDFS